MSACRRSARPGGRSPYSPRRPSRPGWCRRAAETTGTPRQHGSRRQRATQEVPLAMEQGFGAVWAGEGTGDLFATLVRIDRVSGTATARIPLPEPGLRPESSLAVTDDAV